MLRRSPVSSVVFSLLPSLALAQSLPPIPANPSTYVLGAGDQIVLQVTPDGEELSGKPFRIDESGNIDVPMAGVVHAGGLTAVQIEKSLSDKLKVYFRQPQVLVSLAEMRSQPVSVMGAVNAPGVHQLQGHKTLIEVLAMAGGLRADAGYRVKITRGAEWGAIPLPGAAGNGEFSVAEVHLKSLMEAEDPAQNIAVMPHDVLTVPVAEMVYVLGDVKKSGGFVLGERRRISVLQVLALSEGFGPVARPEEARILRLNPGDASRSELPVNLKKILTGKTNDIEMEANDILYVPVNGAKRASMRALESMLTIGTGLAIYRP